jgi:prolyl-tRNA editing enzyme YbaK/EbsC (Cys-tRNA(Pro) deacylase)
MLWAAAGRPDAVFAITPADLERAAGAVVADLAAVPGSG